MPRYRVNHRYSNREQSYDPDEIVEIEAEVAEFLNRDSPGLLVELRDVAAPQANRQVTKPAGRRKEATNE